MVLKADEVEAIVATVAAVVYELSRLCVLTIFLKSIGCGMSGRLEGSCMFWSGRSENGCGHSGVPTKTVKAAMEK